ncbi:DUF3857 domain-containing protein [Geojedonia litorea]|uniref:DUF3857 domain-containing protein n=1 Tax=Geojedonia litorea TaxID=1268269 RepID=A0ABV9N294_9FLAO
MKHLILSAFIVICCYTLDAQNFKFGKISEEELKEKIHPLDSSTSAAVLYKKETVRFDYIQGDGFVQKREVHERIKIYNKDGFDWATRKVRLYNRSNANSENLQSLKGYTYNLIDGKIVEDKLKKDGMFEEVANKYWKFESFTMPNIKEGCVIEFEYEIVSPYLSIDDIDFQYTIPINQLEISVKTPEYFIYNKLQNPRALYVPRLAESTKNNFLTFNDKSRTNANKIGPTSTSFSQSKIDYKDNIILSNESNIPALKAEPLVDNLDNYRSKLILEHTATRYPNEAIKTYSSSWDDVTRTIYDSPEFGSQLDRTGYYDDDINALLAGVTDNLKKAYLIYEFVKSKVKWNNFIGFTSEKGVRSAYKEGAGNSADINLMLVSMLRYAGLKADPVLVSTKNNGIPLFPTRQGFNYVICLVETPEFSALLDATEPYSTINTLPLRTLNWQGRVIRENGSSDWINLTPTVNSSEMIALNVKINPDLTIEGNVRSQTTNYLAMRFRDRFVNLNPEEYVKYLEKDKGQLVVSDLQIENAQLAAEPIKVSYNYTLGDGIEEIGDKLYFSPLLFLTTKENPFKQNHRNYPIDLNHPISDKYMINIMLPDGYKVEYLPKNEKFQFNGETGEFSYLAKENGKYLQLSINFALNTSLVLSSDYDFFKNFYSLLVEKQSEKIVLTKI